MLVLSRKRNESVRIGHQGEITVSVCEIRGDKVRLAFSAPRDIPIHREEVWAAIQEGNAKKPAEPAAA